jgi:hypothetical protein
MAEEAAIAGLANLLGKPLIGMLLQVLCLKYVVEGQDRVGGAGGSDAAEYDHCGYEQIAIAHCRSSDKTRMESS